MNTTVNQFIEIVWEYYSSNKRHFPWRETTDPYSILVSEFMLQQTQTNRVVPKYESFLSVFPTVSCLSQANFPQVFSLWQGLGYNRRAMFLLETAKTIEKKQSSIVPSEVTALEKLPGIGPYTARAIATFAFNQPQIFLETNIRSSLLYFFFPDKTAVHDRELLPLLIQSVDQSNPREWYYALMDYGSMIKKTYGNVNTKSKHYSKQTAFTGSNRQVRGQILKKLVSGQHSRKELLTHLPFTQDQIIANLKTLEDEGFICRDKENLYGLSS